MKNDSHAPSDNESGNQSLFILDSADIKYTILYFFCNQDCSIMYVQLSLCSCMIIFLKLRKLHEKE